MSAAYNRAKPKVDNLRKFFLRVSVAMLSLSKYERTDLTLVQNLCLKQQDFTAVDQAPAGMRH